MRQLIIVVIVIVVGAGVLLVGGVAATLPLESQDAFCASCHTEPETTYYQQSTQKDSVTLAAFHTQKNTACIDCHSGDGALGRATGLQQGAHDLMTYWSGAYHGPAITTHPLGDESCLKCHTNVLQRTRTSGSRAMNGHYHYFLPRWQALDPKAARCITCHTAHTPGRASLKFMGQGKVGKLCEDCHTVLSGEID